MALRAEGPHRGEGSGGRWGPQWVTEAEPIWGSKGAKPPEAKWIWRFDTAKNCLSSQKFEQASLPEKNSTLDDYSFVLLIYSQVALTFINL